MSGICINHSNDNNHEELELKKMPFYEYFQKYVQKDVEQGLLNVYSIKPSNPIRVLGEYLLEKSKDFNLQ